MRTPGQHPRRSPPGCQAFSCELRLAGQMTRRETVTASRWRRGCVGGLGSFVAAERCADVSRRMHYLDHAHPVSLRRIEHQIRADDESSDSRSEILSRFSEKRLPSKGLQRLGDPVDHSIRRVRALVFNGDVAPDVAEVGTNAACECEAAHGLFLSASQVRRPSALTPSANARSARSSSNSTPSP